jgi:hypothetical protein
MQMIIDRFEDDQAVCEKPDRTMTNIPVDKLPPEAREGDVLIVEGESIRIDSAETERRKKSIEERMSRLWKKK